jgi:hypothetical protein
MMSTKFVSSFLKPKKVEGILILATCISSFTVKKQLPAQVTASYPGTWIYCTYRNL